jgi:hypothetical protein
MPAAVKNVAITFLAVAFLLALSSETGKLISDPRQESEVRTRGSLKGLPDSPHTVICSLSGTFVNESGRCLVLWIECRNRYQIGDCLNLQIDLYLYNALNREDRTISRRIYLNP